MEEYNVEDRLITKEDWENWLKSKEEYSDKPLLNLPETSDEDRSKYTAIEWHRYPEKKPKKDDEYLVSVKSGDDILFTSISLWIGSKDTFIDRWNEHISAWAEKPKPYKEEKNND